VRVPPELLANWGTRAAGLLIDISPVLVVSFVLIGIAIAVQDLTLFIVADLVIVIVSIAWPLYNNSYQQGVTGQSLGKRVMKTKLVAQSTGQTIGFGAAFLRQLAHVLEFGIGYLWPLWDDQKQTFADKIMSTVVIKV
jgi:uncharacterized RDD family membrane protein YckC